MIDSTETKYIKWYFIYIPQCSAAELRKGDLKSDNII